VRRAAFSTAPKAYFTKPNATSTYNDDGAIEYGGRNSESGLTVAIFGAGGFLGRYICSELGQVGTKTYMPNRGCELEMRHLKPFFDLGRSWYPEYSPRDKESIYQAIGGEGDRGEERRRLECSDSKRNIRKHCSLQDESL